MGVLNVTPDSFSDGGRFLDHDAAVTHGRAMFDAGADVVDVGGESSRPGAEPVAEDEERRRVLPVVEALAPCGRLSVDTVKEGVAAAAVAAGASLVNDVGGTLFELAADLGVGWVAMHRRGGPRTMNRLARYDDVVSEVTSALAALVAAARAAGVAEVWVDPGIGFAKTAAHNLTLLRRLPVLVEVAGSLGCGVLVGTSRKSFLGAVSVPEGAPPAGIGERLEASLATAVFAMVQGAAMVRVHDVAETVQAARLVGGPARQAAG
jgi:dihydropteroate synthase